MGSYIDTMLDLNHEVGEFSRRFELAEGWRKHLHLGLSAGGFDPLRDALDDDLLLL